MEPSPIFTTMFLMLLCILTWYHLYRLKLMGKIRRIDQHVNRVLALSQAIGRIGFRDPTLGYTGLVMDSEINDFPQIDFKNDQCWRALMLSFELEVADLGNAIKMSGLSDKVKSEYYFDEAMSRSNEMLRSLKLLEKIM